MVMYFINDFFLLAQHAAGLEKMPPTTRTMVYMALLGILLVGMLLVVIVLLGGHWVRRLGSYRRGPAVPADVITNVASPDKAQDQGQKVSPDDPSCTDTISPDDTIVS